jgi:hypothetical protein
MSYYIDDITVRAFSHLYHSLFVTDSHYQVILSDDKAPPDNCIKELNYGVPDVNDGHGGK